MNTSRTAYRSAVHVALATSCILLLPLVAMQITDEVDDAPGLVLFGGLLILGTIALALRSAQRSA